MCYVYRILLHMTSVTPYLDMRKNKTKQNKPEKKTKKHFILSWSRSPFQLNENSAHQLCFYNDIYDVHKIVSNVTIL